MWACTERQSKGKTVGWKRKDRNVIKKIINKSKPLRTLGFSLIQRGRTIKQKVKKNRAVWACDIYVNNEKKKVHTTHWCKSYDLEIIIVIRVIIRDISLFISLHYSYFFFHFCLWLQWFTDNLTNFLISLGTYKYYIPDFILYLRNVVFLAITKKDTKYK